MRGDSYAACALAPSEETIGDVWCRSGLKLVGDSLER